MRTLVSWGMVGQVTYLLSQFLTLVGLTHFASVEEVGAFGLVSAVVIPVFFFFGMNMQVNVASGGHLRFGYNDYRTLLVLFALAGYALVALIGLIAFSGQTFVLLLVIGAAKAAESFSQLAYGVFQRHDRMGLVAASLVLRGTASTTVFLLVLWQGGGVVAAFLAQMLIWAAMTIGHDLRRARQLSRAGGDVEPTERGKLRELAKASVFLGFSGLLGALQGNMPRYMIATLLGVQALGYFTVVGYAMQAVATLVGAITSSLVARLTLYMSKDQGHALRDTLWKLFAGIAVFAVAGVGGSLLVGDWLIETVFGTDYAGLGGLLALILFAAALQAVVLSLQLYLMSARAFRRIVLIRIGTVLVMAMGCAFGGWFGGLVGVVWGMCAAFLVHIVAMAIPVRTIIRAYMAA